MKKLALALCACAMVAVTAPVFAEDAAPAATDTSAATTAAEPTSEATKPMHHGKKHHCKKHCKNHPHGKKETTNTAQNNEAGNPTNTEQTQQN